MSSREPIAIIGMACRFPGGASGLDRFWKLLETKTDAICEVPRGRWDSRKFYSPNPLKAGKAYVKHAGFLQEPIDEFDPLFFRMSPRETEGLDPQQRLLLEVTWESFEDAGVQKSQLEGSDTGVFIGGFCIDANHLYMSALNREIIDSHTATSSSMSLLANRVSYAFNLLGPSVTMDTACSSSLVATHMACLSLWNGECALAVAGGSSVMLRPETPITMSKGQFLSKDGRCKTFDKSADGYARAEGAGVIVLKPLSKALEDNDYIYAQVLASGTNQDGRTSGITLPNVESQKALMRQVYAIAGVKPCDIGYIEAHGTGTQAGDKTEAAALHDVLTEGRAHGDKVVVGSVKTNIGHLEAAAGIAGVIKTALCLDKKTIVPNLHFNEPNPEIPFDANCLDIPTSPRRWEGNGGGPRLAAINSFGYGGTNAHVLLQEPPAPATRGVHAETNEERLVCLSANGEAALQELARKYVNWLRQTEGAIAFDDLVYSMNMRRSHLDNRIILRATSVADIETKLRTFLKQGSCDGLESGHIDPGRIVFVYTGMGPQWWAMGRSLFASEKSFAEKMTECDALFREIAGWSILDEMMKDEATSRIAETAIAQPANFVLQVALTELWKHWGVVPDAVVGHSVGEVASAHVSGCLDLRDALTVSYHRSRLQATLAGTGTMLAVGLSEDEAVARVAKFSGGGDAVAIAAINSPTSVTLAGGRETLETVAAALEKEGVFARFLSVEIPYHSHKMDPIKDELHAVLAGITPRANEIPLYSTVTGGLVQGTALGSGYWWQNVRLPVRFADATAMIARDGFRHFVEVGPHPVLRPSINECLSKAGKKGYTFQSLNRKAEDERATMLASLCTLYTHGVGVGVGRWTPEGGRYVKLPAYAWQKGKYWRESEASRQDRLGNPGPAWFNNDLHLLHPAWEVELNPYFFPYVEDHVVQGNVVFPGAAYVEAGLELCRKQSGKDSCVLENISFVNMLALVDDKVQNIQLHYDAGSRYYSIASATKGDKDHWTLHARGRIVPQEIGSIMKNRGLDEIKSRCSQRVDVDKQYSVLRANGLSYGPLFRTIREWRRGDREVLVELAMPAPLRTDTDRGMLHPVMLDGAFQSMVALFDSDADGPRSFVPVEIEKVLLYGPVGDTAWAHAAIERETPTVIEGRIDILSTAGDVLVSLLGVKCRAIPGHSHETPLDDCLYNVEWVPAADAGRKGPAKSPGPWLVFADETTGNAWLEQFASRGIPCTSVVKGGAFDDSVPGRTVIDPACADHYRRLLAGVSAAQALYLWHLDGPQDSGASKAVLDDVWPLRQLVCAAHDLELDELGVTVVTRSAQRATGDETSFNLRGIAYDGFLPLIANEHRNVQTRAVDVDAETGLDIVLDDILGKSNETAVAWRKGKRFAKRVARAEQQDETGRQTTVVPSHESNMELVIGRPGSLESLHFIRKDRRAPGPNEVEIQVHASSLNFKDLLKVYGRIADNVIADTFFGNTLGMELAGVVVRVGDGVTDIAIGDHVVAPIPGAFCSYATVPTTYVVPRPSTLTFYESPVNIGYLAAYRGLVHCANLQEGEKVLIHNATGGVGIAALQIAKWKKAEIYATAGTKEKREYLREQGIEHVYDSRSLLFAEQILEDTGGYGVDVVLNAIAGDALYKSLNILAAHGRFIEIGKKDIGDDNGLPMRAFNRNITFAAVDIDRMLVDRVPVIQRILKDINALFESGAFQAGPVSIFKASDARDAFGAMAQGKHMGKVVLDFHDDNVPVLEVAQTPALFDRAGSYIVTGGAGGFGMQVAKWMAVNGAGHLYLLGRSGIRSDHDRETFAEVCRNAEASVEKVDVTDRAQVDALVERIRAADKPLRGVVHSAMVLDDGYLRDMTAERFANVLAPKVDGAWNLHEATKNDVLDLFVMFSSISAIVGNAGQANYVAANSFLDGFAHYRRSLGLPATTINWGVLSEAGAVARNADVGSALEKSGMKGLSNAQALRGLTMAIVQRPARMGVFDADWTAIGAAFPALARSATFSHLVSTAGTGGAHSKVRAELLEVLLPLTPDERRKDIEGRLLEKISGILKIPANLIDARKNISDLGIDSLVAVELTVALQRSLAVEITTVDLMGKPSVGDLADMILAQLISDEDALLANLDNLSEEDLDKLLADNAYLEAAK